MSEQLYKVHVSYRYQDIPDTSGSRTPHMQRIVVEMQNELAARRLIVQAQEWLIENDRFGQLVNTYDNGADGLLFVLNDRDTALMLKLALA